MSAAQNWRTRPFARVVVYCSCSFMLFTSSAPLYAALPVPSNQIPIGGVVTHGSAVINPNLSAGRMTIDQSTAKAILEWQSFNIGKDAVVQFNQPSSSSVALNKINDGSPTAIFGALNANGNVYLINNNGILFGSGAQVNVHGLVASTLNISDNKFLNGTLGSAIASGQAAFEGGTAENARIMLEPQTFERDDSGKFVLDSNGKPKIIPAASINTDSGGQVLMFAPNVENYGDISTPDGQTLLAASKNKVYLVNSDKDSDLRGLLVEVDTGGSVTNVGNIVAERGNVTLLGLAVNQNGRVRATTSVDVNGSVRLIARDGAAATERTGSVDTSFTNAQFMDSPTEISTTAGGYLPVATNAGTVTFGQNSVTEVVADSSGKTATDVSVQPQSRIQVMGGVIELKNAAQIKTPGGRVDLVATAAPASMPTAGAVNAGAGRVYLGENSLIDVSGEDVQLAASRRVIEVELRGDELKDSPLQREGVLRGRKVLVDINEGSPLISDLSPWLARVQKGASERMTAGGTVNLLSAGDVVMAQGAGVDISGGSVSYASGLVNTTKLLSHGRIIDIGAADPNRFYDGILGEYTVIHPKWGKSIYGRDSIFARGTFREGYTDGGAGGLLAVETPALYGFDLLSLNASVQQGSRQRAGGIFPAASRVGIDVQVGTSVQNIVMQQTAASQNLAVDALLPLSGGGALLNFSTDNLNRSGVRQLTLRTNGNLHIGESADLKLGAGLWSDPGRDPESGSESKFIASAATIQVDGKLRIPGGEVALTTTQPAANTDAEAKFPLTIGSAAVIDVSGLWTNDLLASRQGEAFQHPIALNGGVITLFADGDLVIADGARLRADAGAHLSVAGKLNGGNGGSITLTTAAQVASDSGSILTLPANAVSAYGFGKGGTLALGANGIAIGEASNDPLTLALTEDFFTQGGFGSYQLNANLHGIRVGDGAEIVLQQQNLQIDDVQKATQLASGSDLRALAKITTLRDELRKPVHLALTSVRSAVGELGNALLRLGSNSRIVADPGAKIALTADDSIFIDGTISAPGGDIFVALKKPVRSSDENYRPELMIWFGENAELLAPATRELKQNATNLLLADIFDGGSISVKADRGAIVAAPGSMFDVSGASFAVDRPRFIGSSVYGYTTSTVNAAAGSIDFTAAEALLVYGDLVGTAAGDGIGGSLSFRLDRNLRTGPAVGSQFAYDDLIVDLYAGLPAWSGLDFSSALPTELRGRGLVGIDQVAAGGFASLALGAANTRDDRTAGPFSYGRVRAATDLEAGALQLADSLIIDATQFDLAGHAVNLSANTVVFGQDDNGLANNGIAQQTGATIAGAGTLTVDAGFIELLGNFGISQAADVHLRSSGDIRLRAHVGKDAANGDHARILAPAKLQTPANLHLSAAQIYPSTLTDYTIELTGASSVFSTANSGAARTPILSAGGKLTVLAPFIEHGGAIAAPLGQILLGNASTQRIELLAGSNLDVSSNYLIPFGRLTSDIAWIYPIHALYPLVIDTPPEKRVELQADAIDMQAGSRIDISGGGDITGFEFIAGPGGSRDFLDVANARGGFAVVPWLNSPIAPYDTVEMTGSGIPAGQIVYLEGGNGLPAGSYAVLPAHYALLPGAYLITPSKADWNPGERGSTIDGTAIVAGRFGRALSGQYDSDWTGYTIETGAAARTRSQYNESTGDEYFADAGVDRAVDAGRVVIDADTALQLNGVIGSQSQQGRGAQLDIIADAIEVVEALNVGSSAIQLLADGLNALGVDSLMLGGRRTRAGDDTTVTVSADSVAIREGTTLAVPDLILAARDSVQLDAGAQIVSTGQSRVETNRFLLNGDGAFLRASTAGQADVARSNVAGTTGVLRLSEGASITGSKSVLLDATADMVLDGALALEQGSLNLTANRISLGEVPVGTSGVAFTTGELAALNAQALRLSSRSSIDFYGSFGFSNDAIELNGGALRSMASSDVSISAANTLQLSNTADVQVADGATGDGTLRLAAKRIELGSERDRDTGMALRGFDRVELGAQQLTREIVGQGQFDVALSGSAGLTADRISVASNGATSINAVGGVDIARANAASAATGIAPLGGKLSIEAARINHGGVIELPSGDLALIANGAAAGDGVNLLAGSVTSVAGRSIAAPEGWVNSSAGKLLLRSDNGNVDAAAGANVSLAGGAHGGDAGALTIKAANGAIDWQATTDAHAAAGAKGGSIDVTKQQLADVDQWLNLIAASGFDQLVHLRSRSGDVAINTAVKAADFEVAADNGSLLLNAGVDARGSRGGRVALYADGDLQLTANARIDASATATDGRGGRVELGTNGELNQAGIPGRLVLAAGSSINVAGGSEGRDGRVQMRAPRIDGDTDVAIDIASGATIDGAEAIVVEAVKVYESSTVDNALMAVWLGEADTFMTNSNAIGQRLGVASINLRPGIEVRSVSDIAITETIDLATTRYGADAANRIAGEPGVLTLRAAGDVVFTGSLRDGMMAEPDRFMTDENGDLVLDEFGSPIPLYGLTIFAGNANMLLLPGESWQYRVAAGADLDATNPLSVVEGNGDLRLLAGADIVTGAADITLAAGRDVIVDAIDSLIASLGLSSYSEYGAGPIDGLELGGWLPDTGSIESGALAWAAGYKRLMYPEQGGDVSIRAGGDVQFAQADTASGESEHFFSDWIMRLGGDDFALALAGVTEEFAATTWGIFASYFNYGDSWNFSSPTPNAQGVAVLGGGDLRLTAGRDILNINAALPTTGKQVGAVGADGVPTTNVVEVLGGGDFYASAGRNIQSPRILADKGAIELFAGADIGAIGGDGLDAVFVLGDTQLSATARGTLAIDAVLNSTVMPQSELLNTQPGQTVQLQNYFFTYSDAAQVSFTSVAGDVDLNHDATALNTVFGSRLAISSVAGSAAAWSIYPPNLDISAFSGDINLNGVTTLFPSSTGVLHLFAGNDINSVAALQMSDAPAAALPSYLNPMNDWLAEYVAGVQTGAAARLIGTELSPLTYTPVHAGDKTPNWITALNGDINNINVVLPKQTRVYAGRDLVDASIAIQHTDQDSISEIVADRDIHYLVELLSSGVVVAGFKQIKISGPGRLDVIAGRDINFGITPGIESLGNSQSSNFAVADSGADITVMAGINGATAVTDADLYNTFANRYFSERDTLGTSFISWFTDGNFGGDTQQLVSVFTGKTYASTTAALADFNNLPLLARQTISLEAYQLQKTAAQSASSSVGYATGGGYRTAYSAELVDFVSSARFAGDLATHVSAATGTAYGSNSEAAAALAALPATQQHGIARAALDNAPLIARREMVLDTLAAEVRKGGIEDAKGFLSRDVERVGFERSTAALELMFPGDSWQGDLNLAFSALRTYDDGDVSIFAPGGKVDVGLSGTVAGFTKGADQLGIVTSLYGAINVFANDDINVNASRIFSLDGAGITLWSSNGDIDAGKGAKTAVSAPKPEFRLNEDGTISTIFPPSVSGSGIQAASNGFKTALDLGPFAADDVLVERQRYFRSLGDGNAYLFAPQGVINAGDAGIAVGGDLLIAAQQVIGADNISVGGVSIGVPTTTSISAGTLSLGDTASSATESATNSMNDAIRDAAAALAESSAAFVTVDVIGLGD